MALPCFTCPEMRVCPAASGRLVTLPRAGTFQLHGALTPSAGRPSRVQPLRAAQPEQDTDSSLSGEWPVNWSLASYEDVGEFFQQKLFKDQASPGTTLRDVMSTSLKTVTPDDRLEDLRTLFNVVSGVPVVKSKDDLTLLGILSKKDTKKAGTYVKDVYSSPPVAARPDNKVADAAVMMLKHKVHRIPIVDSSAKVVGIVTRTDIFTALAHDSN